MRPETEELSYDPEIIDIGENPYAEYQKQFENKRTKKHRKKMQMMRTLIENKYGSISKQDDNLSKEEDLELGEQD